MKKETRKMMAFLGIGFEIVILIILALLVGQAIDESMKWKGIGMTAMICLAFLLWGVHIWSIVKKYNLPEDGS